MRQSQLFTKTSKDIPADEVSKNAQLLVRAGFVDKTMAGVYTFLPLGLRVLNKIEDIVRQEMNNIGAQEILMNSLQPKKLWTDTNRWDIDILFKLKSQTNNEYALACSHEEQVTPLVKKMVTSWKDLPETDPKNKIFPLSVYQIQTKFRDELRAKSGLLRGREFRMKDMYDFHQNWDSLNAYYELVMQAYLRCFERMGLEVYPTEASGGIFTTIPSHEFQAICSAGEDKIYKVPSLGIFFNKEMAPVKAKPWNNLDETVQPRKDILAEGVIGVEEVAKCLGIPIEKTTKTLFYETQDQRLVAACVRGNYKINEEKLMKVAKKHLKLAPSDLVKKITGAEIGYAGLLNLPEDVEIYMDESCDNRKNFEMGANKTGYHSINVNFGRDIPWPEKFYDIKVVEEGDIYPETGEQYEVYTSAEVGNIFKLGTKYSDAVNFKFLDKDNQLKPVIMGCHGIGTTRCMAVIAEIYSDEKGLKWPESVAPFRFHLITHVNKKGDDSINQQIFALANQIYSGKLKLVFNQANQQIDFIKSNESEEILWDDRLNVSLGEKLTDADLIGCPYQIILTRRSIENGNIEIKHRATGQSFQVAIEKVLT